jgi:prepilin-type N-terminal cleavage/methylation domain-containing protein
MKTTKRAGFTLSEMVIAAVVFSIALGAPASLYVSTSRLYRNESAVRELEAISRTILGEIVGRVRLSSSGGTTLATLSTVDFQRTTGYAAGAAVLGDPERFELRYTLADPDDGVDNDGDGLVDECSVAWVENQGLVTERSRRIGEWVRESLEDEIPDNGVDDNGNGLIDEPGLAFAPDGERLTVWLTLERMVSGNRITFTAQRSIAFRNK